MKKLVFAACAIWLSLTVSVFGQVPNYVPTNGLVGWWPFNGNANDESGNGNNGTVNGAALTTDRFGNTNQSYSFDGINDIITCPSNNFPIGTSSRTLSFWYLMNSLNQTNDAKFLIRYGGNSACSDWCATILPSTNYPALDIYLSYVFFDNPLQLGNWQHYVVTFESIDGINILAPKVYYNGVLQSSQYYSDVCSINTLNSLPLFIGGSGSGNIYQYFDGKIDDIAIWNRALTQQEISDIYAANSCSNNLTISPSNNLQNIGDNATFSATTSDPSATFAWQSDFGQGFQTLNNYGNYSGVNTNTLTVSNVQLSEHNQQIRAISTSGNCIDTSNVATIQIADTCITNVTVYDTLLTTVTDTLIISTTLSLPAPNNENTILIYPNPASDHITIDNGNFVAMAGYSIKIENNAGQQVFQSAINQAQFYVDLSTWTGNGLYFVHLIDPQNNTVTVRKIVLQ